MRTNKLMNFLMIVALVAFLFTGCKKDNNTTTTNTNTADPTLTAQNAESQDVVATNVEQSSDDQSDALETSNFATVDSKAASSIRISFSKGNNGTGIDTITWPKVYTISYSNDTITINGEKLTQNGTITVTVDTVPGAKKHWWRNYLERTYTFTGFTVSTDSSSFTLNGTRTLKRLSWTQPTFASIIKNTSLRLDIKDSITSDMTIGVTNGNFTGTFTRNVARTREIKLHYGRPGLTSIIWKPTFVNDSIIFNGIVTGVNLQDSTYSRTITSPITFTICPNYPYNLLATGSITDTEGKSITLVITYGPPVVCKNTITATLNGKTITLSSKLDHKFGK